MPSTNESLDAAQLGEKLTAVRAHLTAGIAAAREGLAVAERAGNLALEQFFHRCLHDLGRACSDARWLNESSTSSSPPAQEEQISTASFAPGDGASGVDVTPERGKRGT